MLTPSAYRTVLESVNPGLCTMKNTKCYYMPFNFPLLIFTFFLSKIKFPDTRKEDDSALTRDNPLGKQVRTGTQIQGGYQNARFTQ